MQFHLPCDFCNNLINSLSDDNGIDVATYFVNTCMKMVHIYLHIFKQVNVALFPVHANPLKLQ